ncbi:MAG: aspartate-semialdehyde dehydrogenase [Gemmatimonadetes bacterium]|nr:aspartate-semialdehyde dehydrogenase [Gemmatimonadota bacterium]NIQ51957.1 aspartate-semialdehyde dehydrogenase [Gemmatimonadota bacterium]NIU72060.1 aspartate-semialdehyde dehydrogenase [Gammaproteobacteria bacterium]NIX42620.1 aspartate-semialdehyde dehydrogenase [Gemmatimonadota bacterium]
MVGSRIDVGLMGATGTVGLRLAEMLEAHPWFRLAEAGASAGSAGRRFGDALADLGVEDTALSDAVLDLELREPDGEWEAGLLLSALPSDAAAPIERGLAVRGHLVVSNASSHRMDPDVPLIIPEINPEHLELLERQRRRWPGAIVTNPNCSVAGLAVALAPLHRAFGIEAATAVTMQALSGAGRSEGLAERVEDNILPYIPGEEEKIGLEAQKILGVLTGEGIRPAAFPVSAQAHRVPVSHGHLLAVSVKLEREATPEEAAAALSGFEPALDVDLPSASHRLIEVLDERDRPQPRLDRDRGAGMTVSVGRVRRCEALDLKFSALVHNLVRGAAGAALLNAELCRVRGLLGVGGVGAGRGAAP